jgi:hypothetical protein
MKVSLAHLREQGINFAVFDADAVSHLNSDRSRLLSQLVAATRLAGLRVEKAALAFMQGGRLTFYGTPDLVQLLVNARWAPSWTHTVDV